MTERGFTIADLGGSNERLRPITDPVKRIYQGILEGLKAEEIAAKYRVQAGQARKVIQELDRVELFKRVLCGEVVVTGISPEPLAKLAASESFVWSSMARGKDRVEMRSESGMSKETARAMERIIARKWGIEGEHRNARVVAYGAAALLRGDNFLSTE